MSCSGPSTIFTEHGSNRHRTSSVTSSVCSSVLEDCEQIRRCIDDFFHKNSKNCIKVALTDFSINDNMLQIIIVPILSTCWMYCKREINLSKLLKWPETFWTKYYFQNSNIFFVLSICILGNRWNFQNHSRWLRSLLCVVWSLQILWANNLLCRVSCYSFYFPNTFVVLFKSSFYELQYAS